MIITKTEHSSNKCCECHKKTAEITIMTGTHIIPLCLECTWTLGDMIDKTTSTDFTEIKENTDEIDKSNTDNT